MCGCILSRLLFLIGKFCGMFFGVNIWCMVWWFVRMVSGIVKVYDMKWCMSGDGSISGLNGVGGLVCLCDSGVISVSWFMWFVWLRLIVSVIVLLSEWLISMGLLSFSVLMNVVIVWVCVNMFVCDVVLCSDWLVFG